MTRKQRIILIVLGILDISVIALLATVVIQSTRPTPATPPIVHAQISPCEQAMLDTFKTISAPLGEIPVVAWDEAQLYITLKVVYQTTTPPEESAQLVWTALDTVAAVLREGCPMPQTITIALTAQSEMETFHYLAQLAGQDVASWMAGTLPEEDLAAQSHFRQSTQ